MAEKQLYDIFQTAENSLANHPRLIHRLINVYSQYPFEEFFKGFVHCLEIIFHYPIVQSRKTCIKSLDFGAQFTANVMKQAENESIDEDFETPQFICKIIMQALEYTDLAQENMRYYSCQFINLVLKHLGENAQLDDDLYLAIQNSMLESINDRLPSIRLQSITCLLRLQDPLNNDCPVIKAFINCLADPNVAVRSTSVKTIAVTSVTIPKIVKCLYDQNHFVRSEATLKCAHINPIYFRIQDRQKVLQKLFNEDNKVVKKCFHDVLFPKWLGEYKNDILKFLKSIKLDGDDSDINTVDSLTKNILEVYFKSFPINDIIAGLNLSENKLIPYEKLSMEVVAYWNTLITHLRNNEMDDYLDDLQPELLHFCNYIDKFIANSLDELMNKKMDDWQMLEFQYKLNILMVMAGEKDLADEVGRKALHALILNILQHNKLHTKTLYTVINILSELSNTPQEFSMEICTLISDIREPLIEEEEEMIPNEQPRNTLDNNFKLARMKLKLDVLIEEREEAKNEENFQLAAEKHEEVKKLSKEVADMECVPIAVKKTTKVKKLQDDSGTITQYLDILIVVLQIVRKLDDNLHTCIKEVLHPLMDNPTDDVCLRVFKCNCLLSLLDKEYAFDNIKMIATPIVMFHYMSNYDLDILSASMGAIADLVVLYGTSLLGNGSDTTIQKKNSRRLYNQGEFNFENLDMEDYSSEEVMNIIIEIMDDENVVLSEVAVNAVARLLMAGALVTPSLISRVLLKYLNPMMVKNNPKLQQMLISGLLYFANKYTNAVDVIAKAVFSTLNMIVNAPKTNPLSEIDIDNTIHFLAGLTNNAGKDTLVNAHQDLYLELCTKLVKYPNDNCSGVWIKMLLVLQLPTDDKLVLNEIKQRIEIIIEELTDKVLIQKLKKHLSCLIEYLNGSHGMSTIAEITEESVEDDQNSLVAKNANVGKQHRLEGKKANIEEVSSDQEIVEGSEAKRSRLQSSDDDTQTSAFVVPGSSICNKLVVLQNITMKKTNQKLNSDDESGDSAKENKTGTGQKENKERSNISPENKSVISDTDRSSSESEKTCKDTVEVNGCSSNAEDSTTEKEDSQNGNNKRQNGKVSTRIRKKPKRYENPLEEIDKNNKKIELMRRSTKINNDESVSRINGKKGKPKGKQEQKSKVSTGSKKSAKQNAMTSMGMTSNEVDNTTLNESVSVKRKKQRGNVQSISFEDSEETILYTIVESSEFNYSNLEDSTSSRRTKSIVSETSSDDEKPARKSVRLSKKKKGSVK
ncbi:PREDICTED: condensin complex subunit 3-like [Nicrophorus vespilloides]|uniref:Condensin complex subunit 3-like n=1 Tax=Nicrophorus vespilloides TaxID=110193 RepID=A0ABM1MJ61_NICVS|nr:PREDICTED: condensin complex subunit 3-like [Nicrophorus vespilloides]XP_017774612.1 PREDICTED: condensin complex subunit 3-like [Nicrophorus vespilloides]